MKIFVYENISVTRQSNITMKANHECEEFQNNVAEKAVKKKKTNKKKKTEGKNDYPGSL